MLKMLMPDYFYEDEYINYIAYLDAEPFKDVYHIDNTKNFYIYDNIEQRFIESIRKERENVTIKEPALFNIYYHTKMKKWVLNMMENKEAANNRSLYKLYMGIISIAKIEQYDINNIKRRYKIIYKEDMPIDVMKAHTTTSYAETYKEEASMLDMYKSICQLFHIFPGRLFYISEEYPRVNTPMQYNTIGGKRKNRKFIFENNIIKEIVEDDNIDDALPTTALKFIVKNIYDAFFVNKTGSPMYKLIKLEDVVAKTCDYIEEKLAANHIKCDDDGNWHHFFLRKCCTDKDSMDVISVFDNDYNMVIFVEFTYHRDYGLECADGELEQYMKEDSFLLEEGIINENLIPIDIEKWKEKVKDKDFSLEIL